MGEGRTANRSLKKQNLPPSKYTAQFDPSKVATLEDVKKSLGKKEVVLVDTRAPKEFTGETPGRDVGRGGHLPGAVNYRLGYQFCNEGWF